MIPLMRSKRLYPNTPAYTIFQRSFSEDFSDLRGNGVMYKERDVSNLCRNDATTYCGKLWHELYRASKFLPALLRMALRMHLDATPGVVFNAYSNNWNVLTRWAIVYVPNHIRMNGTRFQFCDPPLTITYYYMPNDGMIIFMFVFKKDSSGQGPCIEQYYAWNGKHMHRVSNYGIYYLLEGLHTLGGDEERQDRFFSAFCKLHESQLNSPALPTDLGNLPRLEKVTPVAAYFEEFPKIRRLL